MKNKTTYLFLLTLFIGSLFFSCEKENYITSSDAKLSFSLDTLMFDTIFTTIGSTTQSFRVINPHNQSVLVSSIKLAGGDHSSYRLNIDGEMVNEIEDVTIPANDSIYIFVELTIDPNGVNQPMVVMDSVVFETNNNIQDVNLIAWGQDFVPIKGEILKTTTWTADKPYLIFDYAFVDSLETLTIEPGARIFLHDSAGISVAGTIIVKGTPEKPVTFQGDRLEELYKDVPNQWGGIIIYPNSTQSIFENVEIKNAMVGIQVGHIFLDGGANVKLHNVKIEHMAYFGIYAIKSNIEATNTLIADCGYYCALLIVGGSYEFTHCTVSNQWGNYSNRKTPSVSISNQAWWKKEYFSGDLVKANWNNSIIWGNLDSEIEFGKNDQYSFNFSFDHCLVKLADSIDVSNVGQFYELTKNIDPKFSDTEKYNYVPDSLSPARDIGARYYGEQVPYDLNQVSRLSDVAPDLGAYEYIYNPKKEKKD